MTDKQYIASLIEQGEHEHQDFKYQITDARKIARSISAFANRDGGHLLIGVKDNGAIVGVSSDEEIYMIEQAAQRYCRPPQTVQFKLYSVDGKSIVKADIAPASDRPVKSLDDHDRYMAYYRVGDENVLASGMHVRLMARAQQSGMTAMLHYGEREQTLLDYLQHHGGITTTAVAKLLHCTNATAQDLIVNLCMLDVAEIQYHDGQCLVVGKKDA